MTGEWQLGRHNHLHKDDKVESIALIRAVPAIHDPREFETIVLHSLRSMYGEVSCSMPHGLHVLQCNKQTLETNGGDYSRSSDILICCRQSYLDVLRAALTFPSIPPHLKDTVSLYRFDVIAVQNEYERERTCR
jgi:hypothetical protein|mmetsp:Transcript_17473/g.31534  ORF Transcript_17473/g.31534 Transcript_17473/m.31534 type:complete len:134 (+) Transcript_17473:92-493(+)